MKRRTRKPRVVAFAGCNGAGKSTIAPRVLRGAMAGTEFVNADVIARGLAAFDPDSVALEAGRIMLTRIRALAESQVDFAFETTLASRTFAPWLRELVTQGYEFHLYYVWLSSSDKAVERVSERVKDGGHDVPEETIRRRYLRSIQNFFRLYTPIARFWAALDNSRSRFPRLIATGRYDSPKRIYDDQTWQEIIQSSLADDDRA